jgi:hypothetical protein
MTPIWKDDAIWPLLALLGVLILGAILGILTGMRSVGQI